MTGLPGSTLVNCTFSGNVAIDYGGGISTSGDSPTLSNCIFWGNSAPGGQGPEIALRSSTLTVSYSDIRGGQADAYISGSSTLNWGECNIGEDEIEHRPEFVGWPLDTGTWSADGAYDPETYQVTFTDVSKDWDDNELVGKFVSPGPHGYQPYLLQFVIVANTDKQITVWADWDTIYNSESWAIIGMNYKIYDYHLTSDSPCVDAGNNDAVPGDVSTDLDGNYRFGDDPVQDCPHCPDPADCGDPPIVDMGPYESVSCACFGDLNKDGLVDGRDIQGFVDCALSSVLDANCDCGDFDGDGDVDVDDIPDFVLAILNGPICFVGACCIPDDPATPYCYFCQRRTSLDCEAAGGFFHPTEPVCLQGLCSSYHGLDDCGACCVDEVCEATTTEQVCDDPYDGFWFKGEDCLGSPPFECPPEGACCLPDGSCIVTVQVECEDPMVGGSYLSDGTECSPLGACCFPDGSCMETREDCCTAAGGSYHSGTPCDPNPCVGACSYYDPGSWWTCVSVQTEAACEALAAGGAYAWTLETLCEDLDPLCGGGACCHDDEPSTCERVTIDEQGPGPSFKCDLDEDHYYQDEPCYDEAIGPNSRCQAACCLRDVNPPYELTGVCEEHPEWRCFGSYGDFHEYDDCVPNMCQGACCYEGGVCEEETEFQCVDVAPVGVYQGDGTDCTPNECDFNCPEDRLFDQGADSYVFAPSDAELGVIRYEDYSFSDK